MDSNAVPESAEVLEGIIFERAVARLLVAAVGNSLRRAGIWRSE